MEKYTEAVSAQGGEGHSILSLAAWASLAAPLFYIFGVGYYRGTLAGYGVDYTLFPVSFDEAYINSYFFLRFCLFSAAESILSLGTYISGLPLPLIILFGGLLVLFVYFTLVLCTNSKSRRYLSDLRKQLSSTVNKDSPGPLAAILSGFFAYLILMAVYALIVVVIIFALIFHAPYKSAYGYYKSESEKITKEGYCENQGVFYSECVSVIDENGRLVYKGVLIKSSDKYVSIFSQSGPVVFKMKDGWSVVRELIKGNDSNE